MDEILPFNQLVAMLSALWWPFCRVLAMFSASPIVGESMVPVTVRVLLSLVLAVVLMPASQATAQAINPLSMHALVATGEQAILGFALGLAFHLVVSVVTTLGFLLSSQLGLSMAVMNDPMNGASSDVVTGLLNVLCMLTFFSVDGHLLLTGVLGASFKAWPVGAGLNTLAMQTVVYNVAWVLSAAMLLALPVVFSTLVVQIGMGYLNRVAPSLNLYSLGFSLVTLFGLFMLTQVMVHVPEHYLAMTRQVLDMIDKDLHVH